MLEKYLSDQITAAIKNTHISYYESHAVVYGGWVVDIYINKLLPKVRIQIHNETGHDDFLVAHFVGKLQKKVTKLIEHMQVPLSPQLIMTQFTPQPNLDTLLYEDENE